MFAAGAGLHPELNSMDGMGVQHWFAVYVRSRHEKRVGQHLDARQIEYFLPLYQARREWKDGSRQTVNFPLFPNYLFVRIARRGRVSVLEVPGVLWIVGGGAESSSVDDRYVEFLRESLAQGRIEPHPYMVAGERVRVRSGAMSGMEGVLVREKSGFRVVVTLELIKRSMAVELDASDLERCTPVQYRRSAA